jgi:hypothetical protein
VGVDLFLWVLKTELDDDLEFMHDVVEGVIDSSTTKVKKPKVLPKTPPKLAYTTSQHILLKLCRRKWQNLPNQAITLKWQ